MLIKVAKIVDRQRFEGHGGASSDHQLVRQHLGRHRLQHVHQVAIEQQPEVDQIWPGCGGVSLGGHPELLFIAREFQERRALRTHESLVVVGGGIDQVAEDLFLRPAIGGGFEGHGVVGEIGQARGHGFQQLFEAGDGSDGVGHLRITLATPVLLALSAARITSRCSPGERPVRSRANFSFWESITPSTDSMGTQLLASSEYSQRRRALAASLASHSTWAVAPERRTAPRVTTGGVLSIITGALTRVASRAEAGGLASRSLAITRKKYLPSASTSASKVMELSWVPERSSFHWVSSSPRK